jgi:glycine/D-amino acid oxidase-like deaminating enzyme
VAKYAVEKLGLSRHATPPPSPSPVPTDLHAVKTGDAEVLVQQSVDKIHDRREHGRVDAVIVCTGLSTRFTGGVEDMSLHPVRGQTIRLRAPWVRNGITESGLKNDKGEEIVTYIIPRRSGDVIHFKPFRGFQF